MKKKYVVLFGNHPSLLKLTSGLITTGIPVLTANSEEELLDLTDKYSIAQAIVDGNLIKNGNSKSLFYMKLLRKFVSDYVLLYSFGNIEEKELQNHFDGIIDGNEPINKQVDLIQMYWDSRDIINEEVDRLEAIIAQPDSSENLQTSDRKITSLYVQLMEFKSVLKEFQVIMNNAVMKSEREVLQEIQSALKKYESYVQEDWEDFFSHFVTIHPDFFDSLLARSPKLTNENLKVCAYIKMGVTNKEIYKKMGIQPQSLLQSQSRIKKKLQLPDGISLRQYIRGEF